MLSWLGGHLAIFGLSTSSSGKLLLKLSTYHLEQLWTCLMLRRSTPLPTLTLSFWLVRTTDVVPAETGQPRGHSCWGSKLLLQRVTRGSTGATWWGWVSSPCSMRRGRLP